MPKEQAVERQKSSPLTTRGKPTKFTAESLHQIINLVEWGKSRDEIAGILGVTVASLQVTCSRLGISLRRPKIVNGVCLLRKRTPLCENTSHPPSEHDGRVRRQPTEEQYQGNSQSHATFCRTTRACAHASWGFTPAELFPPPWASAGRENRGFGHSPEAGHQAGREH
jgi:hypothetical protein